MRLAWVVDEGATAATAVTDGSFSLPIGSTCLTAYDVFTHHQLLRQYLNWTVYNREFFM